MSTGAKGGPAETEAERKARETAEAGKGRNLPNGSGNGGGVDPVIEQPPGPERQAVDKAAAGDRLDDDEMADATAWFLSEEPEEEGDRAMKTLALDVGIKKPHIINWVIGSLDRDRIAEIRRQAREEVARKQGKRRSQDPFDDSDEMIANLRIATEGTVVPDLQEMRTSGKVKYADPADALRMRFKAKSGIIDQIAGHVIRLSGYSSDDVTEVDAVKG